MSTSFMELRTSESSDSAAVKIANHIDSITHKSDLFDKLTHNGTAPMSGLGDNFYSKAAPEFLLSRRIPIPGDLKLQIDNVHNNFNMGLFTEISRVWVAIDNSLYMWNYETNDDLSFLDALEASIVKVALIKIKPDVFEPSVVHGLVIGTIADVRLYPVFHSTEPHAPNFAVDLTRCFRVNLDNGNLEDIVSTANGRVFYTANDQLFELVYEKQSSWFGTGLKCKTVNQTTTILGSFIPLPFFSGQKENLEQVSVDKSRNILYCLGKNGSILVFDLGTNGDECKKVCSVPAGQIAHQANLMTQYGYEESTFTNITSIKALEAHQSTQLNLVATTVKGIRIYFSVLQRNVSTSLPHNGQIGLYQSIHQQDVRPQCLRVAHVRFSPGVAPTSIYGDGPQGVSIVYADEYITAMATANRSLVWALSNYFYPVSNIFTESMTECEVTGHVWEIQSVTDKKLPMRPPRDMIVDTPHIHAFYRQQVEGAVRLLICTIEGVFEFTLTNGVEALRDALYNGGAEGKQTTQLWQKLGSTEMIILSLRVLSSDIPLDVRIRPAAEQLLYALKNAPEIVENTSENVPSNQPWSPNESSIADWAHRAPLHCSTPNVPYKYNSVNSPFTPNMSIAAGNAGLSQMRVAPSKRHDALYFFFARLVTPMWNNNMCDVDQGKKLKPAFESSHVDYLIGELRKFGKVMDDYRLVPSLEYNSAPASIFDRVNAEASTLERQSLVALRRLVSSTIETLSLWLLAKEYDLGAISSGMNPSSLPTFAAKSLCQLVAEHSMNGELIRAMIKYFLGDEAGTKELSDNLRSLCPTLYSEDDACVTHGMEQLKAAEKAGVGAVRRKLVASAVEMFKRSIMKVCLATTCQQLTEKVGAFEHVVELCLYRAQKEDVKQLALLKYKYEGSNEDLEVQLAEKRRAECYKVITDELEKVEQEASTSGNKRNEAALNRDLLIKEVLNSDDQLAHASVFRWLLSKNKPNVILQSDSPFIEFFLTHEINAGRGQQHFQLLWRFYEKSGHYVKATNLLAKLADNDNVDLVQRCAYLSHAILCAKTSKDPSVADRIDELRDKLDVANIQLKIKEALDVPGKRNQEQVKLLNGEIMSLETLLLNYVTPFNLYEIKLAIFHCANMYIEEYIMETWEYIIQDEFTRSNDVSRLCESLLTVLGRLYSVYKGTKYFPREGIVKRVLEIGSGGASAHRQHLPDTFYPQLCEHIGMELIEFLQLLADEFRTGNGDEWFSRNESGQFYITNVALRISKSLLVDVENATPVNRKRLSRECVQHMLPFIRRASDVSASARLQQIEQELTAVKNRFSALSN